METYRSNGKLLLTGEYVVLDGALSLALPAKYGQSLTVEKNDSSAINWTSIDEMGNAWFKASFELDFIRSKNDLGQLDKISNRLIQILRAAWSQNPNFIEAHQGLSVTTNLEFNRSWGLGTSSTLINNIASWAKIDAYQLLKDTFGGSGYDIACAQNNQPILYQLKNGSPKIEHVSFNPEFLGNLYFVYLNQKQDSREGIASYKALDKIDKNVINRINALTQGILKCESLHEFELLLTEHELIIAELIKQKPVKQRLFKDFEGSIKSLGAWGGDFILVTSAVDPSDYFETKGYKTILPYSELIL